MRPCKASHHRVGVVKVSPRIQGRYRTLGFAEVSVKTKVAILEMRFQKNEAHPYKKHQRAPCPEVFMDCVLTLSDQFADRNLDLTAKIARTF
jgi:hypothetical protein